MISRRELLSALSVLPAMRLLRGQDSPKFSANVKVVNLLATVRDKQGAVVRGLTKDDFLLDEDGRPQTITYFSEQSDLPLTLGLLVDTSGSQVRVLPEERSASYKFFGQVLREDRDLAFVIHFDYEVELLQDLTASRALLEKALELMEAPQLQRRGQGGGGYPGGGGGGYPGGGYPGGGYPGGGYPGGRYPRGGGQGRGRNGGTTLYDAVLLASDDLMKKQTGRKALIVLSDGVDTGSKVSIDEAIESAQRANTLVYSVFFSDPEGYGHGVGGFGGPRIGRRGGWGGRGPGMGFPDGKKVLQRISRETGGGFFEVSRKQPIDKVYATIEEDLRNQYSLGYTPDRADSSGGYRRIHLTIKRKGLTVQTREGYYAS